MRALFEKKDFIENNKIYPKVCEYLFKECDIVILDKYNFTRGTSKMHISILSESKIETDDDIAGINNDLFKQAYIFLEENRIKDLQTVINEMFKEIESLNRLLYNEEIFKKIEEADKEHLKKIYYTLMSDSKYQKEFPTFETYYNKIGDIKANYLRYYYKEFSTFNEYKLDIRKKIVWSVIEQYAYVMFTRKWLSKYQKDIINTKRIYQEDGSLYITSYFIKLTEELKKELLNLGSFFDLEQPYTLENICFCKDGYCYFVSETHEDNSELCVNKIEEYKKLKSVGVVFAPDKHFFTKKENLFYEDYSLKEETMKMPPQNIKLHILNGIKSINENYHLDLPVNQDDIICYERTKDVFLFEKLIYDNKEDIKIIMNKLNNHDKNILEEKLDIIYKGLNEWETKKYKENFNYDYKNEEEVYFYSNTQRDRETLLIYNPKEKAIYHLSNAIFK